MILSILAAATLAQTAPLPPLKAADTVPGGCAILISRSEGVPAEELRAFALVLDQALRADGVPVPLPPGEISSRAGAAILACSRARPCLAEVGRGLFAGAVVTLDVARVFGTISFELAILDVVSGSPLAEKVFATPGDTALVDAQFTEFARTVRYALLSLPEFEAATPALADTPKPLKLIPAEPSSPDSPARPAPAPVAAYVMTGAAGAAGLTAGIFGAMSLAMWRQTIPDETHRISLQRSELPAFHRNQLITGISGGLCLAFTATALHLWLNPPMPQRAPRPINEAD